MKQNQNLQQFVAQKYEEFVNSKDGHTLKAAIEFDYIYDTNFEFDIGEAKNAQIE